MAPRHALLEVLSEQRRVSKGDDHGSEATPEARHLLHDGSKVPRETINEGHSTVKESWSEETVRLLENWAMWLANDRKPVSTISPYPAYRLAARGKRAGNVIPIISVEAERTDKIIVAMVPRYQQPLRLHYLWVTRSVENKARSCSCAISTYYVRLDEAHAMFGREWHGTLANRLKSAV